MTDSAMAAEKEADVDAEWKKFAEKRDIAPRRRTMWYGNRAASIAAIIGTSIVAVAAGIAVTVKVAEHKAEPTMNDGVQIEAGVTDRAEDAITVQTDSAIADLSPVLFEDETLDNIMTRIAAVYGVEVVFNNMDAASLHLYYRLDPSRTLDEIVSQINSFEQINIKRNGNTLTID